MPFNPLVLMDARIYWATADLTGFSNKVDLHSSAVDLDRTTFGSQGWHERTAGVYDTAVGVDSYWEAGDLSMPDDMFWANLGGAVPASIAATSGASGTPIYLTRITESDNKPGAKHGDLLAQTTNGKGNRPLVDGLVMHPMGTPRTASGSGTGYQLGAVSAAQRIYCNYHLMSFAGAPTLTVKLQSSVDNTFAAPTDRLTFTASAALDAQHLSLLGPITDTWWRAVWTLTGGVSPSVMFNMSAGIGPK